MVRECRKHGLTEPSENWVRYLTLQGVLPNSLVCRYCTLIASQ